MIIVRTRAARDRRPPITVATPGAAANTPMTIAANFIAHLRTDPPINEFVQRERRKVRANQRTEARIVSMTKAVVACARTTAKPTRSSAPPAPRSTSPSTGSYRRRLLYDRALGTIGVNLWVSKPTVTTSTIATATTAGTRCGTSKSRAMRRMDGELDSVLQLRFNNTTGGPVGFAVIREIGRLRNVDVAVLSRNAPDSSRSLRVRGLMAGGRKASSSTLHPRASRPSGQ